MARRGPPTLLMNKSLRWIQLACTCQGTCFSTFRKDIGISQSFFSFCFIVLWFQKKQLYSTFGKATVVMLYHRHAETLATIQLSCQKWTNAGILCLYQPHRVYSSQLHKNKRVKRFKNWLIRLETDLWKKMSVNFFDLTHHSWQRSMIVTKSRWSRTDPLH